MEMSSTWRLRRRRDVGGRALGSWEASFPQFKRDAEEWQVPSYVILSVGNMKAFVKTSIRSAASGNDVFVGPKVLPQQNDGADVSWRPLSARRFRFHLLLRDPKQRISLLGGALATAGVIIDGGIAIGKVVSVWVVSDNFIFWSMVASMVLKIVGLFLVIWRGLLEDK